MFLHIQVKLEQSENKLDLDKLAKRREQILHELRGTFEFIDLTYIY